MPRYTHMIHKQSINFEEPRPLIKTRKVDGKKFYFFLSILIISITMDFAFRSQYTRNQLSSINTINTRSGRKEILSFVHFRLSILIIFNTNSKNPEQILEPFANVSFCNSSIKRFVQSFVGKLKELREWHASRSTRFRGSKWNGLAG